MKPGRVRRATEREEYFLGCHANRFAIMLEGDSFQVAFTPRIHQLRPGKYRHAIAAEHSLQFRRSVRVESAQDMFAALDHYHLGVETSEELGELDCYCAATEDNQRFRRRHQRERFVAGQITGLLELGQRRR